MRCRSDRSDFRRCVCRRTCHRSTFGARRTHCRKHRSDCDLSARPRNHHRSTRDRRRTASSDCTAGSHRAQTRARRKRPCSMLACPCTACCKRRSSSRLFADRNPRRSCCRSRRLGYCTARAAACWARTAGQLRPARTRARLACKLLRSTPPCTPCHGRARCLVGRRSRRPCPGSHRSRRAASHCLRTGRADRLRKHACLTCSDLGRAFLPGLRSRRRTSRSMHPRPRLRLPQTTHTVRARSPRDRSHRPGCGL